MPFIGKSGEPRRHAEFGVQSRDCPIHGPSPRTRIPTRDVSYNANRINSFLFLARANWGRLRGHKRRRRGGQRRNRTFERRRVAAASAARRAARDHATAAAAVLVMTPRCHCKQGQRQRQQQISKAHGEGLLSCQEGCGMQHRRTGSSAAGSPVPYGGGAGLCGALVSNARNSPKSMPSRRPEATRLLRR